MYEKFFITVMTSWLFGNFARYISAGWDTNWKQWRPFWGGCFVRIIHTLISKCTNKIWLLGGCCTLWGAWCIGISAYIWKCMNVLKCMNMICLLGSCCALWVGCDLCLNNTCIHGSVSIKSIVSRVVVSESNMCVLLCVNIYIRCCVWIKSIF